MSEMKHQQAKRMSIYMQQRIKKDVWQKYEE